MKRSMCIMLAGTILLSACGSPTTPQAADKTTKLEMRVYQVPVEDTDMLRETLSKTLALGEKSGIGTVTSPGPGQLVVLAPASLQDSIGTTLKTIKPIATAKQDATAGKQLQLTYWNVDAIPGKGVEDPALGTLGETLAKVSQNLGDVHFQLNSRASGISSFGPQVNTTYSATGGTGSYTGNLQYSLSPRPEGALLNISLTEISPPPAGSHATSFDEKRFSTAVIISLGQTIVLSDIPVLDSSVKSDAQAQGKTVRLNIIRVDEVSSK